MSVYVDSLFPTPSKCNWRFSHACHIFADNEDELHAFVASIGLRRAWFQNHPRLPHYDMTKTKRLLAVKLGAIEVSARFTGQWMRERQPDPTQNRQSRPV